MSTTLAMRGSKMLLLAAVAFFFTLVALNNTTDYDSNFQFVRHVLRMDSTFPGNRGMWRAIDAAWIHTAFYVGIIVWEMANAVLGWWGALRLLGALRAPAAEFQRAKGMGVAALTSGMLLWFLAFLSVGGEWFLMWQSKTWNGQDAAFRMFAVEALVLILLMLPEPGGDEFVG